MMQRSSFTLMEMVIATTIFSIMMLFLYQSSSTLEKSNKVMHKRIQEDTKRANITKLLFLDLIHASDVKITPLEKEYDRVEITNTRNSLHGLSQSNVYYIVTREEPTLYRLETIKTLTFPLNDVYLDEVFIDKISDDITQFRTYQNGKKVLVHLEAANMKKQLFEITLPNFK
jgi:prepilin-type N-terminal cleavage/methylation domain-containing protein